MHPKHRLQGTPSATGLHFTLKLQQIRMRKEHHGKAAHQRVMEAIVDALRASGSADWGEGLGGEIDHGLHGQTG
jgi:hypothetical protein